MNRAFPKGSGVQAYCCLSNTAIGQEKQGRNRRMFMFCNSAFQAVKSSGRFLLLRIKSLLLLASFDNFTLQSGGIQRTSSENCITNNGLKWILWPTANRPVSQSCFICWANSSSDMIVTYHVSLLWNQSPLLGCDERLLPTSWHVEIFESAHKWLPHNAKPKPA